MRAPGGLPCCDLHGRNCEPPSELCCGGCTEVQHPGHTDGSICSAPDVWRSPITTPSLTPPELHALTLTRELVDLVCGQVIGYGTSRQHDVAEFVWHVHAIQHTIMSQAAARAYPTQLRLLGESLR